MWALYSSHHQKYLKKRASKDSWVNPPLPASHQKRSDGPDELLFQGFPVKIERNFYLQVDPKESNHKELSRRSSSVSSESVQESETGTDVYEGVKDLTCELYKMAEIAANERQGFVKDGLDVDQLDYDTTDMWFRKNILKHELPANGIQCAIESRYARSPFGKCITRRSPMDMKEFLKESDFSIDGLIPGMPPSEQLKLLKMKERLLIIDRWQELWEAVRPPMTNWHSMSKAGFAKEMQRHGSFLRDKRLQILETQSREALMDLQRTFIQDSFV